MAKIVAVDMINIPDLIIIGDNQSDLTAVVKIEFHELDIKMQMEYMLYFFIYDIHGKVDIPLIITNWDESKLFPLALEDTSDDFLGLHKQKIIATTTTLEITTDISLKLGIVNRQKSHYTKKLETFAVLVPAISIASKWSKPYSSNIDY